VKPKKQGSAGDALVAQVESKRVIGKWRCALTEPALF
jgi:hypothetical protein